MPKGTIALNVLKLCAQATCTNQARPLGKASLRGPWPPLLLHQDPPAPVRHLVSLSALVHAQAPSAWHMVPAHAEHPANAPCPPPWGSPSSTTAPLSSFLGFMVKALPSVFPAWSKISCLVTHMCQNAGLFPYGEQPLGLWCSPFPMGGTSPPIPTTALALLLRKPPDARNPGGRGCIQVRGRGLGL